MNSSNRSIIEPIFGDQARKELPIPRPINDYNHGMGGGRHGELIAYGVRPAEAEHAYVEGTVLFLFQNLVGECLQVTHVERAPTQR
jgi:hypothetical protein